MHHKKDVNTNYGNVNHYYKVILNIEYQNNNNDNDDRVSPKLHYYYSYLHFGAERCHGSAYEWFPVLLIGWKHVTNVIQTLQGNAGSHFVTVGNTNGMNTTIQ